MKNFIMKFNFFFLLFLVIAGAAITNSAFPQGSSFVQTHGRILFYNGKPMLLKGINLGNWLEPEGYMFNFKNTNSYRLINDLINELIGPAETAKFWKTYRQRYITKEDIALIKKSGLNSVRIPFDYKLFLSEEHPGIWTDEGFQLIDKVIGWCKEEKIWVILDLHCAPGGQTGDNIDDGWGYPFLFKSNESQNLTIQLWKKISVRYKNEPIVIGYDLLNEPIAPYFNTAELNKLLEPLYKKIVASIREVDTNHIVFLGGAQWDSEFKVFGKPFDSKSAYTFHKYWSDTTQHVIQEYVDFRSKNNVPIWLGESGENTSEWINSFRNLLERNDIGWCFWPYKKLDATTCMVSIHTTTEYKSIIQYAEEPRNTFEEIRKNKPPKEIIEKALNDFLNNIQLKNCTINDGYLNALGLKEN
ncbi:MAG: glycoside hydrolase family 5 protein [Ignavibacteriaceae bacterium]